MQTVTLGYASQHLKQLLAEVSAGEEIVIMENSQPLGRLVAERVEGGARTERSGAKGWPFWGWFNEEVTLPDDLDAPIPDEFWEVLKA